MSASEGGAPPAELEQAVLDLLAGRDEGKTICPSEAARRVRPDGWREEMEPARQVARRMASEGRIEILQRGETLDPEAEFRGPIRLRLRD